MISWIISNTALFIALVVGLALWVSLATEYVKDRVKIDTPLVVLIIAFIGTCVMYFCGSAYLGLAFLWYEAIPILLCCVFVSYIAQNGYDKLVKKYKDLMGDDDDEDEEDDEEEEMW